MNFWGEFLRKKGSMKENTSKDTSAFNLDFLKKRFYLKLEFHTLGYSEIICEAPSVAN